MDNILQWCASNIALIIALVIGAANLLVSIFRKKAKVIDTIHEFILDRLPLLIASAEKLYGKGSGLDKKTFVMLDMCGLISDKFDIDPSIYVDFISDSIEKILSTPQKKEEK